MTRPAIDRIAQLRAVLAQLDGQLTDGQLTDEQVADFARCAALAGVSVGRWVIQCAAVKTADVIDAQQATERRERRVPPRASERQRR